MQNDIEILKMIIDCCDDIIYDVEYFGNDLEDYIDNSTFQRSTSFSISQIGEYAKKLSTDIKTKYPDVEWKKIAGMRDVIIHNYMHIDIEELWVTITHEVPALKKYCETIIAKEP